MNFFFCYNFNLIYLFKIFNKKKLEKLVFINHLSKLNYNLILMNFFKVWTFI